MLKKATLIIAALLLTAGALDAQEHHRRGLWGGVGFGWASLNCFDCGADGSESGWGGAGRLGGTVSPSFRLAAGTNTWNESEGSVTVQAGSLELQGFWFPGAGDFFALGGAGLGYAAVDWDIEDTYFAFTAGAGYTINLGESKAWALVPEVSLTTFANDALTYYVNLNFSFWWN